MRVTTSAKRCAALSAFNSDHQMDNTQDAARIRIAVALVVLRHKPRNQSCAGCLLDLRARFPAHNTFEEETIEDAWRERACLLEEEVRNLKRKAALETAELETLRASIPTTTQESNAGDHQGSGPSKKRKKKPNPPCKETTPQQKSISHFSDLQAVLSNLTSGTDLPLLLDPLNVFNAYQKLLLVWTRESHSSEFASNLTSSAYDLLRTLGGLLHAIILPHRQAPKNSAEIVNVIDAVLDSVLTCVLNVFTTTMSTSESSRHPQPNPLLDDFLGSLVLDILVPTIKCFSHLTRFSLSSSIQGTKTLGKKVTRPEAVPSPFQSCSDVLPCLLALLKRVFANLHVSNTKFLPRTGEILDFIALSAVTEISKLWRIDDRPLYTLPDDQAQDTAITAGLNSGVQLSPADDRPERGTRLTRDDRIYLLARKEALWYLTVIAHEALNPTSGALREVSPKNTGGRSELTALVQEQIANILSSLLVQTTSELCHEEGASRSVRTCEHRLLQMDEMERGLIMGLVERAWLGGVSGENTS